LSIFSLNLVSQGNTFPATPKAGNLELVDPAVGQNEWIFHATHHLALLCISFHCWRSKSIDNFSSFNIELFVGEENKDFPLLGVVIHFSKLLGIIGYYVEAF
jgi:hypothetical protein